MPRIIQTQAFEKRQLIAQSSPPLARAPWLALPGVRGEADEKHEAPMAPTAPTLLQTRGTRQDHGRPLHIARHGSDAPSAASLPRTIINAFGVAVVAPASLGEPGDSRPHHFARAGATGTRASGPAEISPAITAQLVHGFVQFHVLKDSPATLDELVCACTAQLPGVTLSPNAGGRTGCESSGDHWRQKRLDQAHGQWACNHQCIYLIGTSAVAPLLV